MYLSLKLQLWPQRSQPTCSSCSSAPGRYTIPVGSGTSRKTCCMLPNMTVWTIRSDGAITQAKSPDAVRALSIHDSVARAPTQSEYNTHRQSNAVGQFCYSQHTLIQLSSMIGRPEGHSRHSRHRAALITHVDNFLEERLTCGSELPRLRGA